MKITATEHVTLDGVMQAPRESAGGHPWGYMQIGFVDDRVVVPVVLRHPDDPVDERGSGTGRHILFQAVPEPKTVKNWVHLVLLAARLRASFEYPIGRGPRSVLMPSRLNPYISFSDNARQAMLFYQDVFGGSLALHTFGEFGAPDAPGADKIMHGMLETGSGFTLMGADTPPGLEHIPGNNIAVSLSGDDAEELRDYWEKLSDGGSVSVPLGKQMWGDEFGMCVDQFGVAWMVNIGQPQV